MAKDTLQKVIDQDAKNLDQKITLVHIGKTFELSVRGEQAVGHVFDHFPLAQLRSSQAPDYKIRWVDSRQFQFTWQEWQEEVSAHYIVGDQRIHLERDYVALFEDSTILLIASYELGRGFWAFLEKLAVTQDQ